MLKFRKYFITGLIVLLPAFLTLYIIVLLFRFAYHRIDLPINSYLERQLGFFIPGLGFLAFFFIIFLAGFLSSFLSRKIGPLFEKQFSRLPLIRQLYPSVKQIVLFLFTQRRHLFKMVVLVEYPRKGVWSIGFVTNETAKVIEDKLGKKLYNVFLASTPGPLTGFLLIVPRQDLVFLDISVEDALKLLVSAGVVNPDKLQEGAKEDL